MYNRLLIVLAATLASATNHIASAQEVTLKGITSFAENTFYSRGFESFIEKVKADGKGSSKSPTSANRRRCRHSRLAMRSKVGSSTLPTGAFYTNLMPEADTTVHRGYL